LHGVGLQPAALHCHSTRVSLNQLIECCRNSSRLAADSRLAFKIGSHIHLTSYGMPGLAMLCSANLRRAVELASRYRPLVTPIANICFTERNKLAFWRIEPIFHARIDPQLYAFVTELQIAIQISFHRDILGDGLTPRQIWLAYPYPVAGSTLADLAGCSVLYGQPSNELIFDASWMDAPSKFANPATCASLIAICDEQLSELLKRSGVAGKVRSVLLKDISSYPDFETTARLLRLPPRTLRRQLRQQSTSYQELLDEVRTQAAAKYLQKTTMTNEDIAFALGFSDAANFRQAFRRWTKKTPSEFRGAVNDISAAEVFAQ